MQDLTKGPIHKLIITMAVPIAVGLLIQTLYFLVDLYFVGALGETALAGVSAAGNLFFFVMALTQVFNVGCATLVSHAIGRKDTAQANKIYTHSVFYGLISTIACFIFGYLLGHHYFAAVSADEATYQAGLSYFYWFLPSLALQFVLTTIAASMRGAGLVKPFMTIQVFAILLNTLLSPLLITGVSILPKMGVAGAALASSISAVFALLLTLNYLRKSEHTLKITASYFKGNWDVLKQILKIGVPAGSEFMLTFLYMAVIFWALSQFNSAEQAGFGLGSRIMQAAFLPVMAIAFAAPAIAGQNYAAGKIKRVHQTYKITMYITVVLMFLISLPCILLPELFFIAFTNDAEVLNSATTFLSYIGFNFVPAGIVFSAAAMFQAFGNTLPALLGTALRVGSFCLLLAFFMSQQALTVTTMWSISVASSLLQCVVVLILLHLTLKQRIYSKAIKHKPQPTNEHEVNLA